MGIPRQTYGFESWNGSAAALISDFPRGATETFPDDFFGDDFRMSAESVWRMRGCGFDFGRVEFEKDRLCRIELQFYRQTRGHGSATIPNDLPLESNGLQIGNREPH
jgi:hypothetical protein